MEKWWKKRKGRKKERDREADGERGCRRKNLGYLATECSLPSFHPVP